MVKVTEGTVAVITGASSGIGRATALLFASRGASVALASRRARPLEDLARQCEQVGGKAIAVPTDVADEAAVARLAEHAVEAFGGIDVWVNNAAVACFATVEETPTDVFRRLLDVNVMGTVFGVKAAIPIMRARGGGVIINVASILGKATVPYLGAYNASKFAVVGLSETLRMELKDANVAVTTVMPPATDTNFYLHAANYTGHAVRPPSPVYEPETIAEAILACAERPRREVAVGATPKLQRFLHALFPALYERTSKPYGDEMLFLDAPAPPTPGSVLEPMAAGTTVHGGWKEGETPTAPRSERGGRPAT